MANMQHITAQPLIARLVAEKSYNTERLEVHVREDVVNGLFTVLVPGGLLGDGEEYYSTDVLLHAMQRASEELTQHMLESGM